MTIAEALRCVAPPATAASNKEREVRQAAFARIYDELHALARKIHGLGIDVEDVASEIACHLMDTGPREHDSVPSTDLAARSYLSRAIRNRLIDRHRAASRLHGDEDLERLEAPQATPEHGDEAERVLLQRAERLLYDQAIPAMARNTAGRFDRDAFVATIAEMRAIHRETLTIETLLAKDGGVTTAGRNRLYKQHERARTRLLTHLPDWLRARGLSQELEAAIRALAAYELAARVTRGERG